MFRDILIVMAKTVLLASMLGHKTCLNKFKRIEIISSIFSNHNGMKLEISYRGEMGKTQTCGD